MGAFDAIADEAEGRVPSELLILLLVYAATDSPFCSCMDPSVMPEKVSGNPAFEEMGCSQEPGQVQGSQRYYQE